MKLEGFTPGPWRVGVKQAEKIVYNAAGWAVANATVYHGKEDAETVAANARLIAAAPDLLRERDELREALAGLIDQIEGIGIEDWNGAEGFDVNPARALLARLT